MEGLFAKFSAIIAWQETVALALRSPLLATRPEPPAAATSTPPWRARDRVRRSLLSRTAALQVPQLANPFVLLLFPPPTPRNAAAAHIHADELTLAVAPPFQTRSTPTDPAKSFASSPRS